MKPKILITGRNWRIAVNVAEHLEADQGYRAVRCPAEEDVLPDMVAREKPDIAVICLVDEAMETIGLYDAFITQMDNKRIPTIVVAHKGDLDAFKASTRIKEIYFLPRPISILSLYSTLFEIEKELGLDTVEEETEPESPGLFNPFVKQEPQIFIKQEPQIKRKRILVVDDDPEQLSQIKEHLKEFYDVTAVRSGPDALNFISKHNIDLMLLDYMMPKMDGSEVLYQMRTTRAYAQMPVIFLTGMTEREKVVKTLVELKPQGYIVKPAKKSEIVAKIIDVLG